MSRGFLFIGLIILGDYKQTNKQVGMHIWNYHIIVPYMLQVTIPKAMKFLIVKTLNLPALTYPSFNLVINELSNAEIKYIIYGTHFLNG